MTRLRSCYFCGTTAGLSEYETLPGDLREGSASQRVVLCDRCHAKLTNVLAPIVERFGGAPDSEEHAAGTSASAAPDAVTDPDRSPQTDVTFAGAVGDDDTSGASIPDRRPPESRRSTESEESAEVPESTELEGSAERTEGSSPDEGDAADTVTPDLGQVGETDEHGTTTGAETDATDTTAAGGAGDPDTTTEDASEASTADASEATDQSPAQRAATGDDLDRVYHKLLRFLRNREFPIPRAEAEAVAQSAYDLSGSESTTIIQRAVDRGVLEERDGELHRT
jgi:hypothetical protein